MPFSFKDKGKEEKNQAKQLTNTQKTFVNKIRFDSLRLTF